MLTAVLGSVHSGQMFDRVTSHKLSLTAEHIHFTHTWLVGANTCMTEQNLVLLLETSGWLWKYTKQSHNSFFVTTVMKPWQKQLSACEISFTKQTHCLNSCKSFEMCLESCKTVTDSLILLGLCMWQISSESFKGKGYHLSHWMSQKCHSPQCLPMCRSSQNGHTPSMNTLRSTGDVSKIPHLRYPWGCGVVDLMARNTQQKSHRKQKNRHKWTSRFPRLYFVR